MSPGSDLALGLVVAGITLQMVTRSPMAMAARGLLRLLRVPPASARRHTVPVLAGLRLGIALGVGLVAYRTGPVAALGQLAVILAALMCVTDLRWRWLPLDWTVSFALCGLAIGAGTGQMGQALVDGLALGAGAAAVQALFRAVRGVEGLGTGDVLLIGGLAAHLGAMDALRCVAAAAIAAIAMHALLRLLGRKVTPEIPYGAYLTAVFVLTPKISGNL